MLQIVNALDFDTLVKVESNSPEEWFFTKGERLLLAVNDLLIDAGSGFEPRLLGDDWAENTPDVCDANGARDAQGAELNRDVWCCGKSRLFDDVESLWTSRSEHDSEKLSSVKECDGDCRTRLLAWIKNLICSLHFISCLCAKMGNPSLFRIFFYKLFVQKMSNLKA